MTISSLLDSLGVIALAGLICGVLDISVTLTLNKLKGTPATKLLQGIASGILGLKAFTGGVSTAGLGLAIHFLIATAAAAFYYVASRKLSVLIGHAMIYGALYGIAVHLVMTFIVLPSSSIRRPFSFSAFATQLVIHIFCVGLPIALVIRHFSHVYRMVATVMHVL